MAWVSFKKGDPLPAGALRACQTRAEGSLYVGRTAATGEVGKLTVTCVPYSGVQNIGDLKCHYSGVCAQGEILIIPNDFEARWQPCSRGVALPVNSFVACRYDRDGDLYVGRISASGEVGKLTATNGTKVNNLWLHSAWMAYTSGEVLVVKRMVSVVGMSSFISDVPVSLAAPIAMANVVKVPQDAALKVLLMKARQLAMSAREMPLDSVEEDGGKLAEDAYGLHITDDARIIREQLCGFIEEAVAVAGPRTAAKREEQQQEMVAELPASLRAKLEKTPDEELQYLKANPQALDDWLLSLPEATECLKHVEEICKTNGGVARTLLAREAELCEAEIMESSGTLALEPRREAVRCLLVQRDEIMKRQSPALLVAALTQRAAAQDEEAEHLLMDVLDGGELDSDALARFKQQFLQKKTEKHWRLAVMSTLEQ